MIEKRRYGHYRCLMCEVLAELNYQGAKPALRKVLNDTEEDFVIKECAERALRRLEEPRS